MLDISELHSGLQLDRGPIGLRYAVRHCHVWVNAGDVGLWMLLEERLVIALGRDLPL
jgi:hypothetical protein